MQILGLNKTKGVLTRIDAFLFKVEKARRQEL